MRKSYGLSALVLIAAISLAACGGGGGGGGAVAPPGGGGTGVTLGTLIASPAVPPVLSFPQNIASKDTGTINTFGEFFPGQANVWSLDADFALLDGYDNQFEYALSMNVISGPTASTLFPADQVYSELTFYTPVMVAADGVKTAVVSDGKTIELTPSGMSTAVAPLEGTYSVYLNATSDSHIQQTLNLTSLPTQTQIILSWKDNVSIEPGPVFGYNPSYRVVARDVNGTLLRELYNYTGTNPPSGHSVDIGISYALGGKNIVLSFEFKSMTEPWNRAFAVVDSVSVKDMSGAEYVTNGNFETGDLTGWTANTPSEVQNITSGMRPLEGLNVTRSFYTLPNNLWARWVDVFENTTAGPITRTVTYDTSLGSSGAGIIYYTPGTNSKALTSWDGAAEDRDIGMVFGSGATKVDMGPSASALNSFDGNQYILVTYDITVPANGRVAIVNFIIMDGTDTGQLGVYTAKATEIDTEAAKIMSNFWTDVQYRAGMTQQQIDAIINMH